MGPTDTHIVGQPGAQLKSQFLRCGPPFIFCGVSSKRREPSGLDEGLTLHKVVPHASPPSDWHVFNPANVSSQQVSSIDAGACVCVCVRVVPRLIIQLTGSFCSGVYIGIISRQGEGAHCGRPFDRQLCPLLGKYCVIHAMCIYGQSMLQVRVKAVMGIVILLSPQENTAVACPHDRSSFLLWQGHLVVI